MTTLQEKIDAIAYELQNTPNADCGLTRRLVDKAIQELREDIQTMPSCTICPDCKQPTLSRREVLALIGEKKQ